MSCYICNDKCMELQDELRSNIKGIYTTPIIIDGKEINPVNERMRENRIIASKVYYVVDMYDKHTEGKYEDLLGEVCVFCYHFKEGHDYGRNKNWPISSSQKVCSPAQPLFFYEKGEKGGFLTATQIYKAYDIEKIKGEKDNLKEKNIAFLKRAIQEASEIIKTEEKRISEWKTSIKKLLEDKSIKMTISDITAHIKHDDRDEVKSLLEEMHKDGDIDFAGSGRYFIYSEEKKEPKKAVPKTEEVDVEKELEKYKGLLDKGLITQEEYDTKRKQILGL